jgi:hypothetical protein
MASRFKRVREIFAPDRKFAASISAFFMMICGSQVAGAQRVTGTEADTVALSAILKFAAADTAPIDLSVDPRPLTANAAFQYEIEAQAIARVSDDVIRRRTEVIRTAGLRVADTTMVNQSRKCPGVLVISPPDSLGRVDAKRVPGCPEGSFDVLAVGPLRPGSAILPGDSVYDRGTETAAHGYWAARVILLGVGHGRSSTLAADYVLAYRAGTWVVIKKVGLMYSD